ncbi:MAG: sulfite oxidase-like oxidoreductase [Candidatus Doudnabacteria bacterium]|nr:sulfite oxidase-like oxidoreductase [Candidatus Doudnabacteria bacterium]
MTVQSFNENYVKAKVQQAHRAKDTVKQQANSAFPGQHVTTAWPILDLGIRPVFDPATWDLTIDGLVENPMSYSWESFSQLPRHRARADFHCVTRWSRLDNLWEGVFFSSIVAQVRPTEQARFVLFASSDGYTTNLELSELEQENCLLATHHDNRPLSKEHGGPLRMIIPHLYGWKGAKWVRKVTFSAADQPGFWEVRGYHNRGRVDLEERYSD